MIILLRHTSASESVRVEVLHRPAVGDRVEHPTLGESVVRHVYTNIKPAVIVAVSPGSASW